MSDLERWLQGLGLGRYAALFAAHDIDRDVLPDLTEQDLEKLGISLGHRKKLLRAMAELAEGGRRGMRNVLSATGEPPQGVPAGGLPTVTSPLQASACWRLAAG